MPFVSKKFVEAMLFYACADSYKRRGVHPKGSPVRYEASPIVRDHGGRARAVLQELQRRRFFTRIRRLFRREPVAVGPRVITVPGPLFPASSFQSISHEPEAPPLWTIDKDGGLILTDCLIGSADAAAPAREPIHTEEV